MSKNILKLVGEDKKYSNPNELTNTIENHNDPITELYINKFNSSHYYVVSNLAKYLETCPKSVQTIKTLHYKEISRKILADVCICEKKYCFGDCAALDMNTNMLHSFHGLALTELYIYSYHIGSELNSVLIDPLVQSLDQLKLFHYSGFQSHQKIEIDFSNNKKLEKVCLSYYNGPIDTLLSLKDCTLLKEFICCSFFYGDESEQIVDFLTNECQFSLKILCFGRGELEITFDQLKRLFQKHSALVHYTNEFAMKKWNSIIFMPSIKSFYISSEYFGSLEFEFITKSIYNVTWFYSDRCYNLTDKDVEMLTSQWKNIEYLHLVHIGKCTKLGFLFLSKCENLKQLQMTNSPGILFDDVDFYLTRKNDKLEFGSFTFNQDQELEDIRILMDKHNIKKIPHCKADDRIIKFPSQ